MRPDFGCNLHELVFAPNDGVTEAKAEFERAVAQNADDPKANYFLGLAAEQDFTAFSRQAVAQLQKLMEESNLSTGGHVLDFAGGRIDASILRQLLIALAMIVIMLLRPKGLWPSPEHGKSLSK